MRGVLAGSVFALLSCLLLASLANPVFGDDKAGEGHGSTPVYNVTIHRHGEEVEKKFDVSKDSDAAELTNHLKRGEVGHLKLEEQLNILELKWDLGLWTFVVFVLLFLILRAKAWPLILEGLQKREEVIRTSREEAQRDRDEAQRLRDQFQAEMNRAQDKVREILDEGRRDAQHTTDEMVAKARAEIQTERDRLRREIETARDQALQELWNQTAQLATLVSAKAIRRSIGLDDHRRLVDEALAELRDAGTERQRQVASV